MIGRRKPLACQELVEIVTDYFDGAMSRRDRNRFEAHISACGNCSTYVEQMRQTIELTGRLTVEDVSPEAELVLLEAFRAWHTA